MNQQPLVSIVIPTLNAASLIEKCLQSIKRQTYQQIEIIVVDGHSQDNTVAIAKRYTNEVYSFGPDQSHGRVYGGPYQRNYGANRARGEYIHLVDADMELTIRVTEACVIKLLATGADALIIPEQFHGTSFWARCKALEKQCYRDDDTMEAPRLVKKSAWDAIGGVDASLGGIEDRDLVRKLRDGGYKTERITEVVLNDEGQLTLLGSWKKKYLYGKAARRYLGKEQPGQIYQQFTPFKGAYLRHWKILIKHPLLFLGFVVMRTGEYISAALGITKSIIWSDKVKLKSA